MRKWWSRRSRIAVLGAGLLAGSLFVGASFAITSQTFRYSSTRTGYLSISPMGFVPGTADVAQQMESSYGEYLRVTDNSGCFSAPIRLPQGARMKAVRWSYRSGPNYDFNGYLVRQSLEEDAYSIFSVGVPTNHSSTYRHVARAVPLNRQLINNKKFSYAVSACVGTDTYLYGVRIKYTYRNAGD